VWRRASVGSTTSAWVDGRGFVGNGTMNVRGQKMMDYEAVNDGHVTKLGAPRDLREIP
jgi:hypothetical protein